MMIEILEMPVHSISKMCCIHEGMKQNQFSCVI